MTERNIQNVIVVMTDSLQYNYLGCYGNEWIKTPNYDRFAKQATVFENNFTEGLPTVPCRRAMFTGRYTLPFVGWSPLRPEDTTVADILWGTGVQTALVYDTAPMRLPKYGYTRGFEYVQFIHGQELDTAHFEHDDCYLSPDDFLEERSAKGIDPNIVDTMKKEMKCLLAHRQNWRSDEDHQIARVTRHAARYLEEVVEPTKPFFLWVDSFDPHEPYDPPSVWDYSDYDCPYNPGFKGKNQIVQIPGRLGTATPKRSSNTYDPFMPKRFPWWTNGWESFSIKSEVWVCGTIPLSFWSLTMANRMVMTNMAMASCACFAPGLTNTWCIRRYLYAYPGRMAENVSKPLPSPVTLPPLSWIGWDFWIKMGNPQTVLILKTL